VVVNVDEDEQIRKKEQKGRIGEVEVNGLRLAIAMYVIVIPVVVLKKKIKEIRKNVKH